jgi:predicted outer membrane protein
MLDQALVALRARPPAGVDAAYVDGFVSRHRETLRGLLEGALSRKNVGGAP